MNIKLTADDRRLILDVHEERARLRAERIKNNERNIQIGVELKQLSYKLMAEKFECEVHSIKRVENEGL